MDRNGATRPRTLASAFLVAAGALALPVPAQAEAFVQRFTGTVTSVVVHEPGQSSTRFAPDQTLTVTCTIDPEQGQMLTLHSIRYVNPVAAMNFQLGTVTGTLPAGGASSAEVDDDVRTFIDNQMTMIDAYFLHVVPILEDDPAVGVSDLDFRFVTSASAIGGLAIPREFPAEGTFRVSFWEGPGITGSVTGTVAAPVVPVRPATWGRIKGIYAR